MSPLLLALAMFTAVPDDEGFTVLFDGKSAEGWKQAGPGGFKIQDGIATPHGGMGLWYYDKKFKNYVLRLEYRQKEIRSNAGVFIRFPRVENDPWIPVNEGYEIQIAGDKPGTHSTGSVYSFQAATSVPVKPAGEWNHYEIVNIGPMIFITLNGRHINTYKGDRSLQGGMIGLQNHEEKDVVEFRNVRIKELPENATGYHVLFDGSGTKGWKQCGPGEFELADGAITGKGGMGMLWHEQPFKDFILLLDWKVARKEANSGVFVRFPDPGNDPWVAVNKGYEIQICDAGDPKHRTGSVYSFKESSEPPTRSVGDWNHYEIQVVGQKYAMRINGQPVNEYVGDRGLEGFVGLQNHDDGSRVTFRSVRVVTLAPEKKK